MSAPSGQYDDNMRSSPPRLLFGEEIELVRCASV